MNDQEKTEHYIEALLPERTGILSEMESLAREERVPIMEQTGLEAMLLMMSLHKPKQILEIGTAIGYSSLRMADRLKDSTVVTIERDADRIRQARAFHERANAQDRITIIEGDALETADQVSQLGPFDALFIDAAKGQYERFFELYEPMVNEGGVIFSDNILFKGLVPGTRTPEKKRMEQMVKRLQQYNEARMADGRFQSMIYPIGDGLMVSIKEPRNNG
ncbi:O-methyltransferase [Alteribacter keqinensis]|uniref:tRNA 5-hydroxyuridine methyltransferase n=1 Tax=Alteribacter keqinensis TaxID=2483800 RepID=A0A3M7TTK2_9BACI|nr:O-methyltransferase [Alteribacter keqinensis]RNA68773.1 O-methyltransferase [Alteribacter keqinensis]